MNLENLLKFSNFLKRFQILFLKPSRINNRYSWVNSNNIDLLKLMLAVDSTISIIIWLRSQKVMKKKKNEKLSNEDCFRARNQNVEKLLSSLMTQTKRFLTLEIIWKDSKERLIYWLWLINFFFFFRSYKEIWTTSSRRRGF